MSNDSDQPWQGHSPVSPLPATRRRWPWLLLIVIVALACAASVYAWPEIATLVPAPGREASGGGTTAGGKETLPDLLATQQKSEEDLAALSRAVTDQQLKIILDQLVALTSKVETLQRGPPAPGSPPAAVEPPHVPIAQAAPRPRKPPSSASKPSGPISTGGTPLSAAPSDAPH